MRCSSQGGFSSSERARRVQRMADEGAHEFRLHEQIAEGGMRLVRGLGREHHFRVTGQFDDARAAANDW